MSSTVATSMIRRRNSTNSEDLQISKSVSEELKKYEENNILMLENFKRDIKNNARGLEMKMESIETSLKNDVKGLEMKMDNIEARLMEEVKGLKGEMTGLEGRLKGRLEGIAHKVAVYAALVGILLGMVLNCAYDLTKANEQSRLEKSQVKGFKGDMTGLEGRLEKRLEGIAHKLAVYAAFAGAVLTLLLKYILENVTAFTHTKPSLRNDGDNRKTM
ncbi:unnamed protein product [Auanema sp. JU1783]|nr:unnamed protein product [Auanema sp. JU1783]